MQVECYSFYMKHLKHLRMPSESKSWCGQSDSERPVMVVHNSNCLECLKLYQKQRYELWVKSELNPSTTKYLEDMLFCNDLRKLLDE